MDRTMEALEQSEGPRRTNQLGGRYINGKALPIEIRIQIIELARLGIRPCEISRQLKITHGCISKLLSKFQRTGSLEPGSTNVGRPRVITSVIEERIDEYRELQPGIFSWELRDRLLKEGVCSEDVLPSLSSISRMVKKKMAQEKEEVDEVLMKGDNMIERPNFEEYRVKDRTVPTPYTHSIEDILSLGPQYTLATEMSEFDIAESNHIEEDLDSPIFTDGQNSEVDCMSSEMYTQDRSPCEPFPLALQRRKRTRFTSQQLHSLQDEFMRNSYPGPLERKELARCLDVSEARIQVWFSNRRAKGKRRSRSLELNFRSKTVEGTPLPCSCRRSSCPVFLAQPQLVTGPSRLFFPVGFRQSYS